MIKAWLYDFGAVYEDDKGEWRNISPRPEDRADLERAIIPTEDECKRMRELAEWWETFGHIADEGARAELAALLREVAGDGQTTTVLGYEA